MSPDPRKDGTRRGRFAPDDAPLMSNVRVRSRGLAALRYVVLLALASPSQAQELQNWFGDPFFQVSAQLPDCPLPAGPFINEAERRGQAHHRAERGTTCWLEKACERSNAYSYDQEIASAFQSALREHGPLASTTLWVTVQGRVVYIEGCADKPSVASEVEALARALPFVQQAVAIIRTEPSASAPYRLRSSK